MREVGYKYTIDNVAETFSVNPETIRRWCREGKMKFLKLPGEKGEYRFSEGDIKDFIARQSSEPAERGSAGLKGIFVRRG